MTLKIDNTEDTIKGILTGRLDTAAAQQFAIDMAPLMNNADKHRARLQQPQLHIIIRTETVPVA